MAAPGRIELNQPDRGAVLGGGAVHRHGLPRRHVRHRHGRPRHPEGHPRGSRDDLRRQDRRARQRRWRRDRCPLQPSERPGDRSDNLYVAGNEGNDVRKITPDGTVTTLASDLGIEPSGIALDDAGNVYTGGWLGNVLLKIAPDGTVTELAGKRGSPGTTDGEGGAARFQLIITVTSDADDVVWVADVATDLSGVAVRRVTPDGTVTTLKGDWNTYGLPAVVWVSPSGELYATSYPSHTVTRIAWDGMVTLLAGKPDEAGSADGPGDVARFSGPIGITRDASGLFYIVDSDNHTIRTMRCP